MVVYEVCHAQDMDVRKDEQNAGPGSLGPSGVTLPALRTNMNPWGIPPSIPLSVTSLDSLSYTKERLGNPILSQKRKRKPREVEQIMSSICRFEQSRDKQEILWCRCRANDKW